MVYLGIDPGTALTGYGFIREHKNQKLEVIDFGVISTHKTIPTEKRLLIIHDELKKMINLHRPIECAVEKLFFQRNVTTAISVGQARGVVLYTLASSEIKIAEYTPLEIKQSVVGYGGASKVQVQSMVKALLNLEVIPKPDDAADALAVAICHCHSRKMKNLYNNN